jgi:Zn-dependent protease
MDISALFFIAVLIMSVVVHEVSHGYVANMLGDPTARLSGRLTLNPIPHIDLVGSIVVPLLLYLSTHGGFMFGWAKPVPVNEHNLKNKKWGMGLVGVAGVFANFLLAVIFGLLIRFSDTIGLSQSFVEISFTIMLINLVLGVFNLIPVPPLDGSKVLFSLLPFRLHYIEEMIERYWIVLLVLVLFFASNLIYPVIEFLIRLIVG